MMPPRSPQGRQAPPDSPKTETLDLIIERLVFGGDGLARREGQVVFVPFTVPGERVIAQIAEERENRSPQGHRDRQRSFVKAELLDVVAPSENRIRPRCPHFGVCGGCQLQHMSYEAQLEAKRGFVVESLQRLGGIKDPPVCTVLPSPLEWHYRHQVQLMLGRSRGQATVGFHRTGTHEVVDVAECPVAHASLNRVLASLRAWVSSNPHAVFDPKKRRGWLRGVEMRANHDATEMTVCLIAERPQPHDLRALGAHLTRQVPAIAGVAYRLGERSRSRPPAPAQPLMGQRHVNTLVAEARLRVSVDSFAQVNARQASRLAEAAIALAAPQPGATVIDLYSGTGLFALVAAARGATVYAVESSTSAVEDAGHNAEASKGQQPRPDSPHGTVTVLHSPAARGLSLLRARGVSPEVVFFDPPRGGADRQTLDELVRLGAPRLVYISCDPATLARDVQHLTRKRYSLTMVQPVDMFPQTHHVEAVALLTR